MFCNQCGSPNPDGSKFCSACGGQIQRVGEPASVNQAEPRYTSHVNGYGEVMQDERKFDLEWRTFMSSPIVLITIILFSISIFMTLFNVIKTVNDASYVYSLAGSSENMVAIILTAMVLLTPMILILIGFWMIYGDAYDKTPRPIKTTGLRLVKGSVITMMVMIFAALFLLAISVLFLLKSYTRLGGYFGSDAGEKAILIYVLFIAVCVFSGVFFTFTIKLVKNLINIAESRIPDTQYFFGYAIFLFILTGISFVLQAVFGTITFAGVLSCGIYVMFGVSLILFKDKMQRLESAPDRNYYI